VGRLLGDPSVYMCGRSESFCFVYRARVKTDFDNFGRPRQIDERLLLDLTREAPIVPEPCVNLPGAPYIGLSPQGMYLFVCTAHLSNAVQ
jgi:hypothetical protein